MSIFDKFAHPATSAKTDVAATPTPEPNPVMAQVPAPTTATPVAGAPEALPVLQHQSAFNLNKVKGLKSNKMALLGIFGGVMLVLAIVLQIALSSKPKVDTTPSPTAKSGPDITGTDTLTTDWPLYQDPYNSYELAIPSDWSTLDTTANIETTKSFALPDNVRFEISLTKTKASNVESYLSDLDNSRSTSWEGRPSRVINKTASIRIGDYDGIERTELISAAGIEQLVAYIMIDDDVFSFALTPTGSATAVTNQELVRRFHLALSTFKITNVADRLGSWKTYESTKVDGLSYPAYTVSFPATWGINTKKSEGSETLTISRNGYKISVTQAAVGQAVCLFKDSPSFQGSSGDLRTKDYTEYSTSTGYVLRRYFKGNDGDNSVFLFCGKADADTYFVTPLPMGGLTYTVPAKYDDGVLKEMDSIVKTIQAK